jgi:hypothetical protein
MSVPLTTLPSMPSPRNPVFRLTTCPTLPRTHLSSTFCCLARPTPSTPVILSILETWSTTSSLHATATRLTIPRTSPMVRCRIDRVHYVNCNPFGRGAGLGWRSSLEVQLENRVKSRSQLGRVLGPKYLLVRIATISASTPSSSQLGFKRPARGMTSTFDATKVTAIIKVTKVPYGGCSWHLLGGRQAACG